MELALIFVWTTITSFWGKRGKLIKMTFKWLGELVMAGYKKVISMADLTSWQARNLSEFAPHSWTETYHSIIHEFRALIFTLYSPLSFFFFFKKGWIIFLSKKCNCRDWQFFKALKILHLFAALSLHMLMHLGFADFGTVLQQNNEPEINSLAIMHILFPYSISNQMSCLLNLYTKSVDFNQYISDVRRKQTQGFLKSN